MSLKTWMTEFYSVPAENVKSALGAINHCIRKWEGLRPENLERHGMVALRPQRHKYNTDSYDIIEKTMVSELNADTCDWSGHEAIAHGVFRIDAKTCALCQLHRANCTRCELAAARDGKDCYSFRADEEELTPFDVWGERQDPEYMIFWLVKARTDITPESKL